MHLVQLSMLHLHRPGLSWPRCNLYPLAPPPCVHACCAPPLTPAPAASVPNKEDTAALVRALGGNLLHRLPAPDASTAASPASAGRTIGTKAPKTAPRPAATRDKDGGQVVLQLPDPLVFVDPDAASATTNGAAGRQFAATAAAAEGLGVPLLSYRWLLDCAAGYCLTDWAEYRVAAPRR